MNLNQSISCEICNSGINFRFQVGFIENPEIKFCCPECGIPITINIYQKDLKITYNIKNAYINNTEKKFDTVKFSIQSSAEFITSKNELNPHENFQKKQEMTTNLFSPFIKCSMMFGENNFLKFKQHVQNALDSQKNFHIYERINKLYFLNNKYFINNINTFFEKNNIKMKVKNTEKSKLKGIYMFNITYFNNFLCIGEFSEKNTKILNTINTIKNENKSEFDKLVQYFCKHDKIKIYEKRLLRTIESYIKKFTYFIPSINLKYLENKNSLTNIFEKYTTRTVTFYDIKDIYLQVYENLLEVYDLIIALNNVLYRKDLNNMPSKPSSLNFLKNTKIENLQQFKRLNNGCKIHYLDSEEFFNKLMPNLDNKLRNVIGHESWEYDEYTQKININQKSENKYLLQYTYLCYEMFLNIIIIYKLIVDIKYNNLLIKESVNKAI